MARVDRKLLPLAVAAALAAAGCGASSSEETPPPPADAARDEQVAENESDLRELEEELARAEQGGRGGREREAPPPSSSGARLLDAADIRRFAALERELGGRSGVAVAPLGRGQPVQEAGTLRSGVAWSTIKVALAAAALERGGASTRALAERAITASDNAAAEQLWAGLGGGGAAGRAVEAKLAAAGDATTRVQTQRVRAGFTPFGQTQWSLRAQARFMAGFPCVRGSLEILTLMGSVVAAQRWGLGATGNKAQLKGGWGPSPAGPYLVRQIGVLELGRHPVAVAIATEPAGGSFGEGTANATRIAKWVAENVATRAVPSQPRC